jgi:NitT/TauT family transport system permease protein
MAPLSEPMGQPKPEGEAGRLVPFRGGGFEPRRRRGAAGLAFLAIIAGWQLASMTGLLPRLLMPSASDVALALFHWARTGALTQHVEVSLGRILWGWLLGTIAGIALGFGIALSSLLRSIGIPIVSAFFPIPKIALLPLFILWLGIGEAPKIATIALGVFFPTVINTYSAVDNVPRTLIRMSQSFDIPLRQILWKVVLPGTVPGLLAAFRISASIALILLVAAEMIGADTGIGAIIIAAGNLMQTDQLVAGVVLLSLLGLAIAWIIGRVERHLLRWR